MSAHAFRPPKASLLLYTKQLRGVAKEVGHEIGSPHVLENVHGAQTRLQGYAAQIEPWARFVAGRMLSSVAHANWQGWLGILAERRKLTGDRAHRSRAEFNRWSAASAQIGQGLLDEMESGSAIARVVAAKVGENILLIKDIPLQAANQIGEASTLAYAGGERAKEALSARIIEIQDMTYNRALLIARTEVSKASTALTQARAETVGSKGYIWRTAEDDVVRESHAEMDGQFVPWDDPPELDGMVGQAGEFPNCRCFPEVLL